MTRETVGQVVMAKETLHIVQPYWKDKRKGLVPAEAPPVIVGGSLAASTSNFSTGSTRK